MSESFTLTLYLNKEIVGLIGLFVYILFTLIYVKKINVSNYIATFSSYLYFLLLFVGCIFIWASFDNLQDKFRFPLYLNVGTGFLVTGILYFLFSKLNYKNKENDLIKMKNIITDVAYENNDKIYDYIIIYEENIFEYGEYRDEIFYNKNIEIKAEKSNINNITVPFSWSGSEKIRNNCIINTEGIQKIEIESLNKANNKIKIDLSSTAIKGGDAVLIAFSLKLSDKEWIHDNHLRTSFKRFDNCKIYSSISKVKFHATLQMPENAECSSYREEFTDHEQKFNRIFDLETRTARKIITKRAPGYYYILKWKKPQNLKIKVPYTFSEKINSLIKNSITHILRKIK